MDKRLILLERLMHVIVALAAAYLFYAVFSGTKGVILAAIILLLALVAIFVEIKAGHPKEIDRFPLLVSAFLFLCGCFFLIKGTHFSTARSLSPFFCLISLTGIVGFVQFIVDKDNYPKTLKQFFNQEIRLTIVLDVVMLAGIVLGIIYGRLPLNVATIIIAVIFVVDLVRQIINRR
jgi:hypothetical protein